MAKKRICGPHKGSAWERVLAKRLSLWWSKDSPDFPDGPDDNVFWRTSQSGGRATSRSKVGKGASLQCGDLCAIHPSGEPLLKIITWELKKGYNKATLHDLLDRPAKAKSQVYEEWIDKVERDRVRAGAKYWAIVHQRDRREPIITVPFALWFDIQQLGYIPSQGHCIDTFLDNDPQTRPGMRISTVLLDDFLTWVKPEDLRAVAKQV